MPRVESPPFSRQRGVSVVRMMRISSTPRLSSRAIVSYMTSRLPRCTFVWLRTRKPFSFASRIARSAFSSAWGTPRSQSW